MASQLGLIWLFVASLANAQDKVGPRFDVAAIRPHVLTGGGRVGVSIAPGGRVSVTNQTVNALITYAFDVKSDQVVGGPEWAHTDSYDILATTEGGVVEVPRVRQMLQQLLALRFALQVHTQIKQQPIYVLTVLKGKAKLKSSTADERPTLTFGPGHVRATAESMERLGLLLSRLGDRPVVDATDLTGNYDFELTWTPNDPRDAAIAKPSPTDVRPESHPVLTVAIEEQLGLKLEPKKRDVETVVIDHVERPSAN